MRRRLLRVFLYAAKARGAYGPDHRCFDLDAAKGMVILDVVSGLIAYVEILNRDDVRTLLVAALP